MIGADLNVQGRQGVVEALRKLEQRFKEGSQQVLVGVPEGAGQYEDGQNFATIAAVNNFGSADGRIPERNFMQSAINENQAVYKRLAQFELPKVGQGILTMDRLLNVLGVLAVGHIQEKIADGPFVANADSTKQAKGSDTPLIDTGSMRQSIGYVLPEAGDKVTEGLS